MRFWSRELMGWLLVGLGLFVFYTCYVMLLDERRPRIIEAAPLSFIGFVVFRGGIHLLKVAVAARVCYQATEASAEKKQASQTVLGGRRASRFGPARR